MTNLRSRLLFVMWVIVCSIISNFSDFLIEFFCMLSILNFTYSKSQQKYVVLFDWGPWKNWEKEHDWGSHRPTLSNRTDFHAERSKESQFHRHIFFSLNWSIFKSCLTFPSHLRCFSWDYQIQIGTLQKGYQTWSNSFYCRIRHRQFQKADRWQTHIDRWCRTCSLNWCILPLGASGGLDRNGQCCCSSQLWSNLLLISKVFYQAQEASSDH